MPAKISLVGQTFGRLKVISDAETRRTPQGRTILFSTCLCTCGAVKDINNQNLRDKRTISCGCAQPELASKANRTHGHTSSGGKCHNSITYTAWAGMINRCCNPRASEWKNYGGAGIVVCDRWRHSFENFLEDMGEKPKGMHLDRFPNKYGNYCKDNCRWATPLQNARNKRNNRVLTVLGMTACMSELCEHFGLRIQLVSARIDKLHWDLERAFTTPVKGSSRGTVSA